MQRTIISTDKAPAALGPYSQAISVNNTIYISGQLPIDPASGKMIEGTIGEKTKRILANAAIIAEEAGASLAQVAKTTIFLTNLDDFQEMNEAYAQQFGEILPARSTVQVAALPLGSNIEIEFIVAT